MPKLLKLTIGFAVLGLVITGVITAYLQFTDSTVPSPPLSDRLFTAFVVLCPPALLSIPIIDAEPGTGAFYFLWLVIGLLNAVLYGGVTATVGYLHYLWESD
jgi:hypothetical protein